MMHRVFRTGSDSITPLLRGDGSSTHRGWAARAGAGFTIVEMVIVIIIIGILTTLVIVGYGNWQKSVAEASMKSDLQNAASTLEATRQQSNGYPTTTTSLNNGQGLLASQNNSLNYNSRPYGYCVQATNPKTSSVFSVKSTAPETIINSGCVFASNTTWNGSNSYGYADGPAGSAQFASNGAGYVGPTAVDSQGNIFLADYNNYRIRKITPDGTVSTFAGGGVNYTQDGTGTAAQFNYTSAIAIDGNDNLYVSTGGGLRKVTPQAVVTTLPTGGAAGNIAGVDPSGNMWLAGGSCARKVSQTGTILLTVGNCSASGYQDGTATSALFGTGVSGTVDSKGLLWLIDPGNNRVRKVALDGTVSTFFGTGGAFPGNTPIDGPVATTPLTQLKSIAVDSTGAVWLDTKENFSYLHRIEPDGSYITAVGGTENGTTKTWLMVPEAGGNCLSIDNKRGYIYATGLSSYVYRIAL